MVRIRDWPGAQRLEASGLAGAKNLGKLRGVWEFGSQLLEARAAGQRSRYNESAENWEKLGEFQGVWAPGAAGASSQSYPQVIHRIFM